MKFRKMGIYSCLLVLASLLAACTTETAVNAKEVSDSKADKPNIVIFYVDDLGYGDIGSYGAKGVTTPNIDALAKKGIRFTDAHTSSATCTPSRYSLLTGEHAFRRKAAVLEGDAKMIISTSQPTLPKMLKKAGYATAVIGKWHLGLGDGTDPTNWNEAVKPGPLEVGFDRSFLLPATGDRVPTVYLDDHHVVNLTASDPLFVSYEEKIGNRPTGSENPELRRQDADAQHSNTIINGISRIGWMQGGKSAEWVDEEFYQVFTDQANDFIAAQKTEPFFLFFSFHDIHEPHLPNKKFQGKSTMGLRGDAIVQMDYITGQVIKQLKAQGVFDNTLIIFTSDNGAILNDGYDEQSHDVLGNHKPNGIYRGGKYSAYEAGTRVPTIVHYPNKVTAGESDALISQIDIYASLAKLVGVELASDEAIDSQDTLAAFFNADKSARSQLVEESYTLAIRDGAYKYIRPSTNLRPWITNDKNIESGLSTTAQLFNLDNDPQELTNLASLYPDLVADLEAKLNAVENKKRR